MGSGFALVYERAKTLEERLPGQLLQSYSRGSASARCPSWWCRLALLLKYGVVGGKDAKEMEFMLGAVGVHYIIFYIRFLSRQLCTECVLCGYASYQFMGHSTTNPGMPRQAQDRVFYYASCIKGGFADFYRSLTRLPALCSLKCVL